MAISAYTQKQELSVPERRTQAAEAQALLTATADAHARIRLLRGAVDGRFARDVDAVLLGLESLMQSMKEDRE